MGGHVLRLVAGEPDMQVGAALESPGHPQIGHEAARGVTIVDDAARALERVDVAIDFSIPQGTLRLLGEAAPRGVAVVTGTTGLDDAGRQAIARASEKIAIVQAPNFSLGIRTLVKLVEEAVRRLPGYEIEVLELHHSGKVDAPSGTALRLAETAAKVRGIDLQASAVYHREGETGPRPADAIGLQSLRAGDSPGEHTVYLAGPGERLELTHRALSRDNFAAGAIHAARWAVEQPPGLYSIDDLG